MADQVLAALQKIEGKTFDEEQQRMFLLWSFGTALRRSETAATKWRHVTFSALGITVHVPHSKAGEKDHLGEQEEYTAGCGGAAARLARADGSRTR